MRPPAAPSDASCDTTHGLGWVLVAGALQHVSAYAALRPAQRPRARCPACGGHVTLKLGTVRAHHAAHRPGQECAAAAPESVLHLNVKCHVAAALRDAVGRGVALRVLERCVAGRVAERVDAAAAGAAVATAVEPRPSWERWGTPCAASRETAWLPAGAWDEVVIEQVVTRGDERRRPDVVLRRQGTVVGAIEIRHRHALDAPRVRSLAALGVPWLEVRADAAIAAADGGWTCARPLPVVQRGPGGAWRCARHAAQHDQWLAEGAAERTVRDRRQRSERLRAVRLVDLYYPTGGHRRLLYAAHTVLGDGAATDGAATDGAATDGAAPAWRLLRDGQLVREIDAAEVADGGAARRVREAFRDELRAFAARHAAIVDSPMRWATGPVAAEIARLAARDDGVLARTHPLRYRWAPAQRSWFLPRDLRAVRWDRAPAAALEAHPAADRPPPLRRRVRERAPDPRNPLTAAPAPTDDARATARLDPAAFDGWVAACEELPHATVYVLAAAPGGARTSRVVAMPTGPAAAGALRRLDARLAAGGSQRLWLSYRDDWTRELADLPWLPCFRHERGDVLVSVWGRALRLRDVAAAFVRGDRRLQPAALARANAAGRLRY